jgi:hypothetical protein
MHIFNLSIIVPWILAVDTILILFLVRKVQHFKPQIHKSGITVRKTFTPSTEEEDER